MRLTILCNTQYCIRMAIDDVLYQSQVHEIRRGSVVIAVLMLLEEPQYGYSLIVQLAQLGIEAEANTLYPLLRRLEKLGLLESVWNTEESRPRKYYQTTEMGTEMGRALMGEWARIATRLSSLKGDGE